MDLLKKHSKKTFDFIRGSNTFYKVFGVICSFILLLVFILWTVGFTLDVDEFNYIVDVDSTTVTYDVKYYVTPFTFYNDFYWIFPQEGTIFTLNRDIHNYYNFVKELAPSVEGGYNLFVAPIEELIMINNVCLAAFSFTIIWFVSIIFRLFTHFLRRSVIDNYIVDNYNDAQIIKFQDKIDILPYLSHTRSGLIRQRDHYIMKKVFPEINKSNFDRKRNNNSQPIEEHTEEGK